MRVGVLRLYQKITKYYNRVVQLGEEPWRVAISGAPSLDSLKNLKLWSKKKLEKKIKLSLDKPTMLMVSRMDGSFTACGKKK